MDESEYWSNLEYRVCRELAGMRDGKPRSIWCDGITASQYLLAKRYPCTIGRAWISAGDQYAEWEFTLRLPRRVESREEVDWAALLLAENVTRWLLLDEARRTLTIEPGAAVQDPE